MSNKTFNMSLGNETFCYQWYEEYKKLSYCPTETPKSTHPGRKTLNQINKSFFVYIFEKYFGTYMTFFFLSDFKNELLITLAMG